MSGTIDIVKIAEFIVHRSVMDFMVEQIGFVWCNFVDAEMMKAFTSQSISPTVRTMID